MEVASEYSPHNSAPLLEFPDFLKRAPVHLSTSTRLACDLRALEDVVRILLSAMGVFAAQLAIRCVLVDSWLHGA
jgi:hypothetical protein